MPATDLMRPGMSEETRLEIARLEIARLYDSFPKRVLQGARRCQPTKAQLYKTTGSVPSPHFRVSLRQTAPGGILPKLLKLGATLDQIEVQP